MKRYNFYATMLDGFQNYLDSESTYNKYFAEKMTAEEYEKQAEQEFINKINRVPFESEAADRGTAFNELIDCLILDKKSAAMEISEASNNTITVNYKERLFTFPLNFCVAFSEKFKGATPQVFVEKELLTDYGVVKLYGYIDELMPFAIHDIKTTGNYSAGKYHNNWQHKVYPYCTACNEFVYNVAEFNGRKANYYEEFYSFDFSKDVPDLKEHCERLIEFIESRRALITDKKIFNQH